jgi:DNA helicase-2/ATP-dependent DNA helicase PcrA
MDRGILNREQAAAAAPDTGINLVVAGAGTGKTTTLINKITNVIRNTEMSQENLLVLTFSRKAAEEIKSRLKHSLGMDPGEIFAGTFHSFAFYLLQKYRDEYLKYSGFTSFPILITEDEKEKIIKEIIYSRKEQFLGIPCETVFRLSRRLDRLDWPTLEKLKNSGIFELMKKIPPAYEEQKRGKGLIDFDDMISHAASLLRNSSVMRNDVHNQYKYIFVDEFQDTSNDNFEFLNLLLREKNPSLYMVGDDYQSIYGFRNANVEYIVNINNYFPDATIQKLTLNYRSGKKIIKLSNRFINRNRFRTKKKIIPSRSIEGKVQLHPAEKEESESDIVKKIISGNKYNEDIAVIYRNNYQGDLLKEELGDSITGKAVFITMHASKGLEFKTVIITGISDKIIPDRGSDLEEERRLFYVAITRAKDNLHIIYHNNSRGDQPRFIKELGWQKRIP